jgi:hypothetical protein
MIKMLARLALVVAVAIAAAPQLLPLPGSLLVVEDQPAPSDAALVLDALGAETLSGAERWRQAGLVRDIVVVEAPVRTHALVAYWSDFVAWGLAAPAETPPERLHIVRASSGQPGAQARAALPALRDLGATTVLAPGGGLGSRLTQRELSGVLEPAGMRVRLARMGPPRYDPARWFEVAEGRRAVLDQWLQLLAPYLAAGGDGAA